MFECCLAEPGVEGVLAELGSTDSVGRQGPLTVAESHPCLQTAAHQEQGNRIKRFEPRMKHRCWIGWKLNAAEEGVAGKPKPFSIKPLLHDIDISDRILPAKLL